MRQPPLQFEPGICFHYDPDLQVFKTNYPSDMCHIDREPLSKRRSLLEEVLVGAGIRFSPTVHGSAEQVIRAVREHRLEGVVAKRVNSIYEAGRRSGRWVKLPLKQIGEFVIGGLLPTANTFALLLVGRFDKGQFKFAGKVRWGFDKARRAEVLNSLETCGTDKCPFSNLPNCKADPFDEMVTPMAGDYHDGSQ